MEYLGCCWFPSHLVAFENLMELPLGFSYRLGRSDIDNGLSCAIFGNPVRASELDVWCFNVYQDKE